MKTRHFKKAIADLLWNCSSLGNRLTQFISYKFHLRERYIYTRNDHIRLRYIAMTTLFIMTALSGVLLSSSRSNAVGIYNMPVASIEPASGTNVTGRDIMKMMDTSSRAELSLASLVVEDIEDVSENRPLDREVTIEPGDALSSVMEKEGVGNSEVRNIIAAMKDHFDPRTIKVGQKIALHFDPQLDNAAVQNLSKMKIPLDNLKTLVVARADDKFSAYVDEKPVEVKLRAIEARIETSLSGSAAKAGIPSSIVAEAIRIYSWNVDFQRDIRADDKIEVLYESYETADGNVAKNGDILYANLTLGNREIPLYRFEMGDGRIDYFQPDGRSIRSTLMKTPINGARMSSGFGSRRHPVLGYTKMHKGIDFAAPTGTPIFAAGDGVIEKAGWFSSFGKYVRIRHNNELKTAYAHMSKINPSLKSGSRIKQGEIIGYVGTTGRSTGPHLHYEVLLKNVQVNPRDVNLPTGEQLAGNDKTKFKAAMNDMRQQYASALEGTKVAGSFKSMFFN